VVADRDGLEELQGLGTAFMVGLGSIAVGMVDGVDGPRRLICPSFLVSWSMPLREDGHRLGIGRGNVCLHFKKFRSIVLIGAGTGCRLWYGRVA